jgi:hypothetical protein
MGRREKPLDSGSGPLAAFAGDLRKLRVAAGSPSYRRMAGLALYSPSVLSEAASGHRLPTLAVTMAFVRVCGGDVADWEHRWREICGDNGFEPVAGPEAARPGSMRRARRTRPGFPSAHPRSSGERPNSPAPGLTSAAAAGGRARPGPVAGMGRN